METKFQMKPTCQTGSPKNLSARTIPSPDIAPDYNLTAELRAYLIKQGADMVGFGSIERLDGTPELHRPQRYLPGTVSMVSMALRVNGAVCDLIARSTWKGVDPPSYNSFQMFTLAAINPKLDELAYLGAKFLENRGYKAYPFPANMPHTLKPSPGYPGGVADVSHKHIAVACGVGQIGWHNLLLTPQYGPRQKLNSIATNAPLAPDPMIDGKLCDPEKCGFLCARACPTQAIPRRIEAKTSIQIGQSTVEYGNMVGWRCRWGCSGMLKSVGGYRNIPMPAEEPSDDELMMHKAKIDPWQTRVTNLIGLVPYCGKCLSVCPEPRGARVINRTSAPL
jgi:epoxyqueuosine reductase QueG